MGFRTKMFLELFNINNIFFSSATHFISLPSHFHPLQDENRDSNSRLVVDEDDNGKFRLKRVKALKYFINYFISI